MNPSLDKNLKLASKVIDNLKKRKSYVIIPSILDLVFLILIGVVLSFSLIHLEPIIQQNALNNQAPSLTADEGALLDYYEKQIDYGSQIIAVFSFFAIAALFLWLIFQGINWWMASKFIRKKFSKVMFSLNFFVFSLVSFILLVIIGIFYLDYTVKSRMGMYDIMPLVGINVFSIVFVFLISYFTSVAYGISSKYNIIDALKNTFIIGLKRWKDLLAYCAMIVLLFLLLNYLILPLIGWFITLIPMPELLAWTIYLVIGSAVIFPLFAWARIYLIEVIESK